MSALLVGLASCAVVLRAPPVVRRCSPPTAALRSTSASVVVQPVKLARLLNSVYGSEQILLFGRQDVPDKIMPTLLTFDQGAALEAELGGQGSGWMPDIVVNAALAGKLIARTDFFEAVSRSRLGAWELALKAQKASGLADALVLHLSEHGLRPRSVTLGSAAEEGETDTVGMRDMGANTPAAPSSVRLTAQLPATLVCDAAGDKTVAVPLGGAADAVLLAQHAARRGGALPLSVSAALWELRAISPQRLPETTVEQDCSIDECRI